MTSTTKKFTSTAERACQYDEKATPIRHRREGGRMAEADVVPATDYLHLKRASMVGVI